VAASFSAALHFLDPHGFPTRGIAIIYSNTIYIVVTANNNNQTTSLSDPNQRRGSVDTDEETTIDSNSVRAGSGSTGNDYQSPPPPPSPLPTGRIVDGKDTLNLCDHVVHNQETISLPSTAGSGIVYDAGGATEKERRMVIITGATKRATKLSL
jgi:hypothetical protein